MKKQNKLLRQMILASLFTAMIAVLTCYIKIPTHNGYVHVGDSMIYLAACFLPTPFALFCGALGGMFADLLSGYAIYAIPTFIIKALLTLAFDRKSDKLIVKRNVIALIVGAFITVIGYCIADAVIFSLSSSSFKDMFFSATPWITAAYDMPANLIQAAASLAIFLALGAALDKIKIKSKITER